MIDNKTQRLSLPLPNVDNYLEDDVARLADALNILDEKVATIGDDGKILVSQIPAVALTDTFPVSSEADMLALNAQPGDVAIREDESRSYILMASPATALGNWKVIVNDALLQLGSTDGATKVKALSGKSVQEELDGIKSSGAGQIVFKSRMAESMQTTVQDRLDTSVLLDDFIPPTVNTALEDCSDYIQTAFIEANKMKKFLLGVTGKTYTVSKTIIIPKNRDLSFRDPKATGFYGAGCTFRLLNDIALFESGYIDENGNAVSNFGGDLDTQLSMRSSLGGFTIIAKDDVTYHDNFLIRIQDWHHSSKIHDIYSHISKSGVHSRNNYYLGIDNVALEYSGGGYAGTRFKFDSGHNLCKISRLIATNSQVGYSFEEALTAVELSGLSLEGCVKGIDFMADVYGLKINSCYVEHINMVGIAFNGEIYGAKLSGNYFNFANSPDMYGIYYKDVASTNLYIDISNTFANMTDEGKIFLNKSQTHGVGVVIERPATRTSDILSLLPTAFYGKYVEVRQIVDLGNNARTNKTNGYITGNYAGKFTEGLAAKCGFNIFDVGDGTRILQTAIGHNLSELVYVALHVTLSDGAQVIRGFVMGGEFYRFAPTATGASDVVTLHPSTGANSLSLLVKVPGKVITGISGEVRVI